MAEEILADYNCTTSELYSITETITDNLNNNLAVFAAYKSKYDIAFVDALKEQRLAAMGMPDEEARNAIFKSKRIELIELGKTCCKNFQLLKGYIDDGFEEAQRATKYDAAGQTVYEAAVHKNWERVVTLNTEMLTFIAGNTVELTAGYMPNTFPTKVGDDFLAFNTTYGEMKVARQTGVETSNKIKANNDLYAAIVAVNADAARIFDDEAHLKLFQFSVIKAIVSPPGSASYKVTVKRQADDGVIAGATVVIKTAGNIGITATTNTQGIAEFSNIDPAAYSVTVTATGMQPETFNKEVNTGTAARSEVFMEGV